MEEEKRVLISFTGTEMLYIDDNVTLMRTGQVGDSMAQTMLQDSPDTVRGTGGNPAIIGVPQDLLDRITDAVHAVLYTENHKVKQYDDTEIELSEADIYRLRELANSQVMVGSEHVGLHVKYKLYVALKKLRNPFDDVEDELADMETVEGKELDSDELQAKLDEFLEKDGN